ncbi:GntR family transcriptional regulator [Nonomuraea polychroma]|uniref:GntR family transcriptional regulator n=1 Tax=Nonomuraea polychroma TaxID=46176 RepID=UPI003D9244E1
MATDRWLTGGQVYTQVADRLREQIVTGEFPPGGALPSEAQLCAKFGVARNTVRRGLALLEEEGLITTIPSKGRVVAAIGEQSEPYRYLAIAAELRARIERGELQPGSALPSEAELRRRYGASRNTVRQALAVLEHDGLVVAEHGRGRFVRPSV